MSTVTGPDLSAGRAAVEALMDDTVRFSTVTDADAWTLSPTTLRLEPPAGTVVYEGRCKLKPLSNAAERQTEEGGLTLGLDAYRIDIPIDSVRIPEGATAVLTSSRRFAVVVGEVFAVKRLVSKTLAVQASYVAERRAIVEGGGPISLPGTGGSSDPLVEDPNDPGTFTGGGLTPDPADPGTFLIGA